MATPVVNPDSGEPHEVCMATPHTAVLDDMRRRETALLTGLICEKDALRLAGYPGTIWSGVPSMANLRLHDEVAFYEVAIHGKVYRALARPVPGQDPTEPSENLDYELARAWAPGLRENGWLMEPPTAIPNTPRALVLDLQQALGLNIEDIIDSAFSILSYRRHHGANYPDSMAPSGYGFKELFLMSVGADGNLTTLYETPRGVNPERWTHFLRVLDRKGRDSLAHYAVSSMAVREYGEAGAAAMRTALTLRDGDLPRLPPMSHVPFLELFPFRSILPLERNVGGARR